MVNYRIANALKRNLLPKLGIQVCFCNFNAALTVLITVKVTVFTARNKLMDAKSIKLTNEEKQAIVSKIRSSSTLSNAPTSSALLQYLLDATLKNTTLKEGVIDIEFFGSKEISDRNNPRVRVNVYNLRKKLVAYYEEEGKEDAWRLWIKKGQYKVSFLRVETASKPKTKINWKLILPYSLLVLGLLAFVWSNIKPKAPELWTAFLNENAETNLFIGDHFGMAGKTITTGNGWTRDFEINSNEDFYNLINKNPQLKNKIKPSKYSYSTRMAALATQKLQAIFQTYHQSFDIRFSTQTSIPAIKEKNAIYVGPTKNDNQFLSFFNEGNPFCTIGSNSLEVNNRPGLRDEVFELNLPNNSEEYAIVSKYKSLGDKEHLVFFSQHDIGVSATVAFFTNKDSILKFQNTFLKKHDHFTAIFKVKGKNRTDTNLKLIEVIPF